MKIVNLKQSSDEWHEWRNPTDSVAVGASVVGAIMGVCPYRSKASLLIEKIYNKSMSDVDQYIVDEAHTTEDLCREWLNMKNGWELEAVCVQGEKDYQRISLDGYDFDRDILFEHKMVGEKDFAAMNSAEDFLTKKQSYMYQVMYQSYITQPKEIIIGITNFRGDKERKCFELSPDYFSTSEVEDMLNKVEEFVENVNVKRNTARAKGVI